MSSLLAIQGPLFGTQAPIFQELTIGRAQGATLLLADLQVSRLHAAIRRQGDSYVLVDASSRNGTLVNGERVVGQRTLVPGDELQVGASRFLFDAREYCLPSRYGNAWVVVGGEDPEAPEASRREPGEVALEGGDSGSPVETAWSLKDWLSASVDEEGMVRALLQWLLDRFEAARGAIFSLRPDGRPVLLAVAPALHTLSVNAGLFERCAFGKAVNFCGEVATVTLSAGHRRDEVGVKSILAAPWRLGGDQGGLVWLERGADPGAFDREAVTRLRGLLQMAGPALENARRNRLSRRRQRVEILRDEGERVPGQVILEHAGLLERGRELAASPRPVAVVGPRGTGKDRVARLLHTLGPRWEGPLLRVNCARLTGPQAELELFGIERSVPMTLDQPHAGKLELADGGTLVLEQVDALALEVQDRLLQALLLRRATRRGGEHAVPFDVRIIATSARPLEEWVREGRLREALLPYLAEEVLVLPGLSELSAHILPLALTMVGRLNVRLARQVRGLSASAEQALERREWTLNLWELEDLLIRAMALSEGDVLTREDLELAEFMPARVSTPEAAAGARPSNTLADVERRLLIQALRLARGHRGEAAELLGMPREQLEQKILEYSIEPSRL